MATITWQSTAGSLGDYPAGTSISIKLVATSDDSLSVVRYKILSGSLPSGTLTNPTTLSVSGELSGTLGAVVNTELHTFTIRAYDQYGNMRDRTFSINVNVALAPKFVAPSGLLTSIFDSTWLDFQVQYENSSPDNVVTITHSSGSLPTNMYVTSDGRIRGYAAPPTLSNGSPVKKTYSFTLQLTSNLGNDSAQYSIDVSNQLLLKPPHNRIPAICNSRPANVVTDLDPYQAYYLPSDNTIPAIAANNFFTFKVIGKDFDGDSLVYNFSKLPPGLIGNSSTGWITGIPVMYSSGINDYTITVSVAKDSRPLLASPAEDFKLRVLNGLVDDIVWTSPEHLGTIYNNTVSELALKATSSKTLIYSFVSGNLPANLYIENSGAISGRVAFQPANVLMYPNEELTFSFTVQAYAQEYPTLKSFKTFTITVKQYYDQPIENVYFKIAPSLAGRAILNSLLTDKSLIPDDFLYRPDDLYFGKSSFITAIQAYGVTSSSLQSYLTAIERYHYNRDIILGPIKTAIARDDNGDILYEVVYSDIVDNLVNPDGISIPSEITWPEPINLNLGPWTANDTDAFSSYTDMYTSMSPGFVEKLYPASLDNMRNVLVQNLKQNTDENLLPKWMTSQQLNGNTLGFLKCWVICYTKPNKSAIVKNNIETNWGHSLNEIDCTIDRYVVDKSSTYNWNTNLSIPAWNEIPSEVPNSVDPEQHDLMVLFSRKTILPK